MLPIADPNKGRSFTEDFLAAIIPVWWVLGTIIVGALRFWLIGP